MPQDPRAEAACLQRWRDVYSEAELYKAAVRLYTKPVFQWRKAFTTSTDGKTLYDFAARGLARLDAMHNSLERRSFEFRPAVALHYNFNGKRRTLYGPAADPGFMATCSFRHWGLLLHIARGVALSRDKQRKVQNLFRYAFRRKGRWKKQADPQARARALVNLAADTIEKGIRNVAILDYYLKHVNDEGQLRLLDRWLAEEVLSRVFGGHKKAHFRRISFRELRAMGLPSLLHRHRMICSGRMESPFFIWQREKVRQAFRGTVARLCRSAGETAFSVPRSSSQQQPVREGGCL